MAIIDRGQVLAHGRVADIERRLRVGAVLRVRLLGEGEALEAARAWFAVQPDVVTADLLEDGQVEIGFHGDDDGSARLLATAVGAGLRVVTFSRAASDLEELFLQVTAPDPGRDAGCRHDRPRTRPRRLGALRDIGTGIAAVGVKELRGRMRGRRAFVMLTVYLLLLAGFAWMIEALAERTYSSGFGRLHLRVGRDRADDVHRPAHAPDPDRAGPGARVHGRGDQPRAREADPGPAGHHADLVARDRPRQAGLAP